MCISPSFTDNAGGVNLSLRDGTLCKALDMDSDGDIRIVVLTSLGVADLHQPSEKYWLLQSNFKDFEISGGSRNQCPEYQ